MAADMVQSMEREFFDHVIPFWQSKADTVHGGFYGLLNFDLELDKEAEKGCILNSRILWFFSNAYLELGDESYLATATHAYAFLKEYCLDRTHGGVYWSVTYDGIPMDDTKHTYNQAFAVYALSSYYRASGNREALDLAYGLFDLIEDKCRDEGGYLEAFSVDFKPSTNEKLSENGVMATRTMNTLLHVMEAYTELYKADHNEKVRQKLQEQLVLFRDKVYDADKERLEVFFDADYHPLIDLHSFGHDIEAAWLIDRTIEVLGDEGTEYDLSAITRVLTKKIYDVAFDGESVPAESENGTVLQDRIWWVQCEAVIGFINGWQKDSSQPQYRRAAEAVWEYIQKAIVDPREGSEWYSEVDTEGTPFSRKPIIEPWKCPYHNGRMFLEIRRRLKQEA